MRACLLILQFLKALHTTPATTGDTMDSTDPPSCRELCLGLATGHLAGQLCSQDYCYCGGGGGGGDWQMDCGAEAGFCPAAGVCMAGCTAETCAERATTTATTPPTARPAPGPDCTDLCSGAEVGQVVGDCCHTHYCYCDPTVPGGGWEMSCAEGGMLWCPASTSCSAPPDNQQCRDSDCCSQMHR